MQLTDVAQIAALDAEVSPSPWAESTFTASLKAGHLAWVLECQQEILGFGVISLAADECQILNLAIQPRWQKQGLGTRLIKRMLNFAREHKALYCYLEVRTSNKNAQTLYTKLGFVTMAVRRDYYGTHNGREDAIIMRADLNDSIVSEKV